MRMIAALPSHRDPAPAAAGTPWSAALNATAEVGEVVVTLLALDVVDDQLCMTGVLRVGERPDLRMTTIPTLELATPHGAPLLLVDARVMPRGRLAWMWWTFERPAIVPTCLEASIPNIVFEYRATPRSRTDVEGPWRFSLLVTPPTCPEVDDRWSRGGASQS